MSCIRAGVHVTGTEYVDRGAAIQLVCNASGRPDPPHNVDWYKVCDVQLRTIPSQCLNCKKRLRVDAMLICSN